MSERKYTALRMATAILIAVAITVVIICCVSKEPLNAIYYLFVGPFTSQRNLITILTTATPLMFTGLALALVFKSGNFSMIADACLYTGGWVSAYLAIKLQLGAVVHPLVILLIAAAIGAVIGAIPGILKVFCHANELVTSLMLNYVFFYFGIYMVSSYFVDREAGTFASLKYNQSALLAKLIPNSNLHVGLLIVLALALVLYLLMYKTGFGYQLRVSGSNPDFAKHSGINTSFVIIATQMIAGAVAGVGGSVEQLGMYQRFNWQDSPSYAWDGVIVAILSGNNPRNVPLAALFIGFIRTGADIMSRKSDVQNELVSIVQAVLILFITAERFMAGYKHRMDAKKALAEQQPEQQPKQEVQ